MSNDSSFVYDEHDEIENWLESIQTQADKAALEQISINEQEQFHPTPPINVNDPLKNHFDHWTQKSSRRHVISPRKNKENCSKSSNLSQNSITHISTKRVFGSQVTHSKVFQDASSRTNKNRLQNSLSNSLIGDSNSRKSNQSNCSSFVADSPFPKKSLSQQHVEKKKHSKHKYKEKYQGKSCMRREYNDLKVIRFQTKVLFSFLRRHFDAYKCYVKQRNHQRYKITTLIRRTMTKSICHVIFRVWLMECMQTKFKLTQLIKMTQSRYLRLYFCRLRNQTSKLRQKANVRIFFHIEFHFLQFIMSDV